MFAILSDDQMTTRARVYKTHLSFSADNINIIRRVAGHVGLVMYSVLNVDMKSELLLAVAETLFVNVLTCCSHLVDDV